LLRYWLVILVEHFTLASRRHSLAIRLALTKGAFLGRDVAKRKLYFVDTYRASQTIYRKRLQGMVIHNRYPFLDGNTFNKFSALRPDYYLLINSEILKSHSGRRKACLKLLADRRSV
jgi:hypothetical protein